MAQAVSHRPSGGPKFDTRFYPRSVHVENCGRQCVAMTGLLVVVRFPLSVSL
jgi:hypothetical protein